MKIYTKTDKPNIYFRLKGLTHFLLLWFVLFPIQYVNAQIPHGGRPLEQGAEVRSMLRSAVDYFVEMPAFDLDSILAIDHLPGNRIGGLKFAHKFFVNLSPENSGMVFHTADGTKVWKVGIRSSGAYSLNVLFSDFSLPDGAKVFLYNSDRSTMLGAFTNENRPHGGEFSVAPVDGDELTIEYHEPADAAFSGKICISEVNHDYRGLFRAGTFFNQTTLTCLPDLSCNSKYDTIGHSICLLIIDGTTYCTGTLINNTKKDGEPYLLTASHCLSNNRDLGSRVVVFMNYESPRCNKKIRGSEEFSLSGSTTKALSNEIDFALLRLTEIPPADYRPYFAGWSLDTITANALPFTGIHHPYGEVKKYCVENDSVTKTDWTDKNGNGILDKDEDLNDNGIIDKKEENYKDDRIAANNHWNIKKWETGITWEGSSGSGIFDKNNRFRGGLTGGDSNCNYYTYGDYYFRFDKAWNYFQEASKQLKHWLDPLNPDNVQSPMNLDGLDPYSKNPANRISNILPSDSLGKINLPFPDWGSVFGHNSLGTTHFAEHFTIKESSMIQGVYLIAAKGHNNSNLPITVRVYKGGNEPGDVLGKAVLNPNYIEYINGNFTEKTKTYFTNRENYIRFDSPISVGTDFYVGYEITYPIKSVSDTFYVYAAIRDESTINTTSFMKKEDWYSYTNHPYRPIYTSLWIEPVILGDTITTPNTYHEADKDSLIKEYPIISYSSDESLMYISLPEGWTGITTAELFDLTGKKILESTVSPPIGIIKIAPQQESVIIVRLRNERFVYVLKTLIGHQ